MKTVFAAAAVAGTFGGWRWQRYTAHAQEQQHHQPQQKREAGNWRGEFREISAEDVAAHASRDTGVWVTYKSGVYDVSEFLDQHPGGAKRLMLAAGGSILPFWKQLTIHDKDEVRRILELYRIGNLQGTRNKDFGAEEREAEQMATAVWDNEPRRNSAMPVHAQQPFASETPLSAQTEAGATPNELHFVRHHFPVPNIDAESFCLSVSGEGVTERCIPYADLKSQFAKQSVAVTIQCGGNRRSETMQLFGAENVKGIAWGTGGAGTAVWGGAPLREVLIQAAGGNRTKLDAMASSGSYHVHATGADSDAAVNFEASIPLALAMDSDRDILVAWEMNGEPIPRDHGFPLRLVVPGVVGVRNAKWLTELSVKNHESQGDWTQTNYKMFPSWTTKVVPGVDPVYDTSIQSAITSVKRTGPAAAEVKGWTFCGGGRGVQRVELSADGGRNFTQAATLGAGFNQPPGHKWAWQPWSATVPLTLTAGKDEKKFVVCSRAISTSNDIQPSVAPYNFRGLFFNGYSCADVPPL